MPTASAPGRLDLMGGIADYSGSNVLQAPIKLTTMVNATTDGPADRISVSSAGFGDAHITIDVFAGEDGAVRPLEELATSLRANGTPPWSFYAIGATASWARSQGIPAVRLLGLRLDVESSVPAGMGVSSSASVEVAVLRAVSATFPPAEGGWDPLAPGPALELAHLAWLAETRVAGAPCGTMDQIAVSVGAPGCLLPITCRPGEPGAPVPLPPGVTVLGWASGVQHDVGASPYRFARTACFMAKRMAEAELERAGRFPAELAAVASGAAPRRLGWLSQLPLPFVQAFVAPLLPAAITGKDFVARYGAVDDEASDVQPEAEYPVLAALRFASGEDGRVRAATSVLRLVAAAAAAGAADEAATEAAMRSVGELVSAAHGDYSALGLGCAETDAIVHALTRELGPAAGVYGARVSGGGSGGTVAVLCREDAVAAIRALAAEPRFDFAGTGRPATIIV